MNDPLQILSSRKELDSTRFGYLLEENRKLYGIDSVFPEDSDGWVDEKNMALWIPIADGNRRDGVGDLLEVQGIVSERHRKNPVVLFDHGKQVTLPIAMACERNDDGQYDRSKYTFQIDANERNARLNAYFYQGKGMSGVERGKEYDHALFTEQLYDMVAKRMLGAGSIGYQVIKSLPLQPDYSAGTPEGVHLLKILMLEGSLVVMPANMDTVQKCLAMPTICGKPISPYLVKSLTPFAGPKKVQMGYEPKPAEKSIKELRQKYKATPDKVSSPSARRQRAGIDDTFRAGDTVTARIQLNEPGNINADPIARPGDRLKIVSVNSDGLNMVVERNGRQRQVTASSVRKSLEGAQTKSLDLSGIRKKYRTGKNLRRRLKRSSPGASVIHVSKKDVDAVEEMAKDKGLKAHQLGTADGETKIKLIGDDASADEVAKAFGRPIGVKAMPTGKKSLNGKHKSMDDTELGAVETNDLDMNEGSNEPWGAQVLRKFHADHSAMMKDYDELLGPLEHEGVRAHVTKHLQNIEKALGETEKMWAKHYKDLPGLEGVDAGEESAEDDDNGLVEEELEGETKDADTMDDNANPAASNEPELPDPEEVVEGMKGDEELDQEMKSIRNKYRTKSLKKSVCPKCDGEPCKCNGKKLAAKKKSEEIPVPHGNLSDSSDVPPVDWKPGAGAKLMPHHKAQVSEAAGFLKEIGAPGSQFDDEERMKSFHYHKTLEGMQQVAGDEAGTKSEPGSPEWAAEEANEPEHKAYGNNPEFPSGTRGPVARANDGKYYVLYKGKVVAGPFNSQKEADDKAYQLMSIQQMGKSGDAFGEGEIPPENESGAAGSSDMFKTIGEASETFKRFSQEKAFGDPHREEANKMCKALEGITNAPDEEQKDDEEITDLANEPGEMGQKAAEDDELEKMLKKLKEDNEEQDKKMKSLTRKFLSLNGTR